MKKLKIKPYKLAIKAQEGRRKPREIIPDARIRKMLLEFLYELNARACDLHNDCLDGSDIDDTIDRKIYDAWVRITSNSINSLEERKTTYDFTDWVFGEKKKRKAIMRKRVKK